MSLNELSQLRAYALRLPEGSVARVMRRYAKLLESGAEIPPRMQKQMDAIEAGYNIRIPGNKKAFARMLRDIADRQEEAQFTAKMDKRR